MFRLVTLPGAMPHGSAAFFPLNSRGIPVLWNNRMSAALELAAVQSSKLGLELLVFQFKLANAAVFFLELFIERLNDLLAMVMQSLG